MWDKKINADNNEILRLAYVDYYSRFIFKNDQ